MYVYIFAAASIFHKNCTLLEFFISNVVENIFLSISISGSSYNLTTALVLCQRH